MRALVEVAGPETVRFVRRTRDESAVLWEVSRAEVEALFNPAGR